MPTRASPPGRRTPPRAPEHGERAPDEERAGAARVWLLIAAAIFAVACAPPELESRVRACGLVSDGELPRSPFYAPNDCYRDCLASASCEALEGALCRTDLALLIACDERCAFHCDDGPLLPVESVCNGFDECEGGEDEQDCPTYVCDDGQELVGEHRCDGRWGCPDGSDERGCPLEDGITCDGRTYPAAYRCDGWPNCTDQSDEQGCAELLVECSR